MNIALIGEGNTNLVLAKMLTKKDIKVSLFFVHDFKLFSKFSFFFSFLKGKM